MKEAIKIYSKAGALLGLLVFLISGTIAQDISFTATAPKVVRAGEQFQLVYTLNENVDDFTPPDFGDFRFLGGPSTGSSTSISMTNGRTVRVSTYTFTYYLQAPAKGGKYTLDPAKANYKRNAINSNSLQIEVVGQGQAQNPATSAGTSAQNEATNSASASDQLYVRLHLDKKTAYVGEQITAWVKIYTQVSLSGIDQQFKGPEFPGFYRQNIEIPPLSSLEREKVGDEIYHTGTIQKVMLYPQKSGELIIEPFDLLVEVQQQTQRRPQSIFDDFFGSGYERKRINLKSNRVKLTIKPLPGNQPDGYSGAVGKFKISASSNLSEVNTNDAITYKVEVLGIGNIKLIDRVITDFPPSIDVFDPIRKVQLDKSGGSKGGKVVFEYTAIPRHAGEHEIAPFSLVYFDPSLGSYQTISTQPFTIKVNRAAGDSTTLVSSSLSKEDIELLGSDIRYIETQARLKTRSKYYFGTSWFYGVYLGVIALFIIILIVRKEQIRRSADVAKNRNRKAGKIVSKRLKTSAKLLKSNNAKAFYEELEAALWGYLSNKLDIPFAELSVERADRELELLDLDEQIRNDFKEIIETCQFARYAPGGVQSAMQELFDKAADVINKLDHKL